MNENSYRNSDINSLFDELQNKLPLPDSLKEEKINALIRNDAAQRRKRNKRIAKSLVSIAAVFAIVISAVSLNTNYLKPTLEAQKLEKSENNIQNSFFTFNGELKSYNGYGEIMRTAVKKANENKKLNRFNGFLYGAKDSAVYEGSNMNSGADAAGGDPTSSSSEYKMFGGTNTQVNGVDEADIIKNDGEYIYFNAHKANENKIIITDCRDPKNLKKASEITLKTEKNETSDIAEIYIKDNILIAAANIYSNEETKKYNDTVYCGAGCISSTKIFFYNIADKTNPELIREFSQDGYYNNSRLIGSKLIFWTEYSADFTDADSATDTCIPKTSAGKISADRIASCGEFANAYQIITSIDITDIKDSESVAICADGGLEAYCTNDTLYLACSASVPTKNIREEFNYYKNKKTESGNTEPSEDTTVPTENGGKNEIVSYMEAQNSNEQSSLPYVDITKICAFDISDGIKSTGTGKVLGLPLNQFSIDEYDNTLRIATTAFINCEERNFITVLYKDTLNLAGFLGDIAVGEQIYSARFIENTCYLVTFYRTDPLFVIDLSDYERPEIKGELKIPGFSSYLHPVGSNYLLGIGSGGTDDGLDGSSKISLFDISNPEKPTEADKYIIPNSYLIDSSHKAFCLLGENDYGIAINCMELETNTVGVDCKHCCIFLRVTVKDGKIVNTAQLPVSETDSLINNIRGTYIGSDIFVVTDLGIKSFSADNKQLCELIF